MSRGKCKLCDKIVQMEGNTRYCDKCSVTMKKYTRAMSNYKRGKIKNKPIRPAAKRKVNAPMTLAECCRQAKQMGISYGKYVQTQLEMLG